MVGGMWLNGSGGSAIRTTTMPAASDQQTPAGYGSYGRTPQIHSHHYASEQDAIILCPIYGVDKMKLKYESPTASPRDSAIRAFIGMVND